MISLEQVTCPLRENRELKEGGPAKRTLHQIKKI